MIRYLCLAEGAPRTLAPPHDYGVVLMLRTSLALVTPADQVTALDHAVVTFLDASSAETTDRAESARLFAESRALEAALPEPSRTLMRAVNQRDVATLGRILAPFAEQVGGAPALSPARSPATTAPVFLLHGADDNVIPASESAELERYLTGAGTPRVETLLTPLLSHAEARPTPRIIDLWRLVRFWTRMWDALGSVSGATNTYRDRRPWGLRPRGSRPDAPGRVAERDERWVRASVPAGRWPPDVVLRESGRRGPASRPSGRRVGAPCAGRRGADARGADSPGVGFIKSRISPGVRSRKSPGCSPASVTWPMRMRFSRATGCAIASAILRICRLRPS